MGFGRLSQDVRTVVIAACVGALASGGPILAATVVDYAWNADHVDGRDAVAASAPTDARAGKLVATNSNGRLPSDIIAKAPDSALLNGRTLAEVLAQARKGLPKYVRTVVVGPVGTDLENGAALRDAVAAIDTAKGAYLVRLEPGTYDVGSSTLVLPTGVNLEGAGREATKIVRAGGDSVNTAAVIDAGALELRSVGVESTAGPGKYAVGVVATSNPLRLTNVGITATGGVESVGVNGLQGSWLRFDQSNIEARDASTANTGIRAQSDMILLRDTDVHVDTCSADSGFAIDFDRAGSGGFIKDAWLSACATGTRRAVRFSGTVLYIFDSLVEAAPLAVESTDSFGVIKVFSSILERGTVGTVDCAGTYDWSFRALDADCVRT